MAAHYELPHCKTSPPKTAVSFGCINTCYFAIIDLMWVGIWSNMITGEPRWSNVVQNCPKLSKMVQDWGRVSFGTFFLYHNQMFIGCKVVWHDPRLSEMNQDCLFCPILSNIVHLSNLTRICHKWAIKSCFDGDLVEMAKKCYHPLIVLTSPVILSHHETKSVLEPTWTQINRDMP